MLRLFAKIDPLRWVLLALALLLLALPTWLDGDFWQLAELRALVLGEAVDWSHLPYRDLDTLQGPLVALFYGTLDWLWGRSAIGLRLLGALVLFGQTLLFHRAVLKSRLFEEPTMVPAALFVLLGSASMLFQPLTPPKLALVFLLLALARTFRSLADGNTDRALFAIGIQCGIAGLIDVPSAVLLGSILLTFLLSSRTVVRRYAILIFGFAFPFLFAGAVYELLGDGWASLRPVEWLLTADHHFAVASDGWVIAALPLLTALVAALWIGQARSRWLPRQRQIMWLSVYWLGGVAASILIDPLPGPERLVLALPAVSLLASYGFLAFRKWYWRELLGFLLLTTVVLGAMTPKVNTYGYGSAILREQGTRQRTDGPFSPAGILVLGPDPAPYLAAPAATRYLDWPVAERTFNRLDRYEAVLSLDEALRLGQPARIVDQVGLMPQIQARLPWVEQAYREVAPGDYRR